MTSAARPRVLVVIGTRPEGIKLAPVVAALRERADAVETRVALTGQHTDLMAQVLRVFGFGVDWDLGIMKEGQDLYDVAHRCLDGLRGAAQEYRPDLLLVQGDTASVFFGALVAFFEKIRVGHVEAGLRSGDRWRPYPEEMLRRMTGVLADLHFAPTPRARANLVAENVPAAAVHVTGNTVVDAVRRIAMEARAPADATLRAAVASGRRLVLVTAHRRESFGLPLRTVFVALREIADAHPDVVLVYPVHPNPNVRGPADELLAGHARILLTPPLDYFDLVCALRNAALVITDSGGIQEEAPSFGTPVLVLRDVTERPEGIETGVAQLVGTDGARIVAAADACLRQASAPRTPGSDVPIEPPNPYGDGRAGERIADIIVSTLTGAPRQLEDWSA